MLQYVAFPVADRGGTPFRSLANTNLIGVTLWMGGRPGGDMPAMTTLVPDRLDELIQEAMEEWQIPGLALAVVREGEPDYLRAFGLRDVEAGLPATPDTQFILCSITKSFTALGLAMLVDDGR